MAQTIQIKRSTSNAAPSSSLAAGEIAYSFQSATHKLYIGDGSTNYAIGGKSYTDKLDGIDDNANNYVLPAATSGALGGIKIGYSLDASAKNYPVALSSDKAYVNVPWTDTVYSLPTATASDLGGIKIGTGLTIDGSGVVTADEVTTTAVSTAGALMKTGGTMTGNITMGNDKKVIFGSATDGLIIDNTTTGASGAKRIQEVGSGQLAITGESVFIGHTEDYENDTDDGGLLLAKTNSGTSYLNYMVDQSQMLRIQDGGFTIGDVAYIDATSSSVYTQAVKGVADDDAFYADSNQLLATQQSIKAYVDNTNYTNTNLANYLANATNVNFSHLTFNASTIKSGGTMTLDPAAHVGDSGAVGTVVIEGDLQVKGTTTTIDSNTVAIGDSEIYLNSDLASNTAPSEDAGFRVNRGNENAVYLNWDESADNWMLTEGALDGSNNPIEYTLTHSGSTIDGGSF